MIDLMGDLEGKTFVITGAANGIGYETFKLLRQFNCTIFLVDNCFDKDWNGYVDRLEIEAAKHFMIQCDVRFESDVNRVWREITDYSPIHGVVNSAGISLVEWAEHISLEKFQAVQEVNVHGSFLMARNYARWLDKTSGEEIYGHVVNMGSLGSEQAFRGGAAYVASKGAIKAMTRQMAREFRNRMCFICIQPETLAGPSKISDYVVKRLHQTRKDPEVADRHKCGVVPTEAVARKYFLGSLQADDWQTCNDIARLTVFCLHPWARPLSGSSLKCLAGRS